MEARIPRNFFVERGRGKIFIRVVAKSTFGFKVEIRWKEFAYYP